MDKSKTVAITGANGFLGLALARSLAQSGFKVRALVRRPESIQAVDLFAAGVCFFDLGNELDSSTLKGVDILIHCAYDMSPQTNKMEDSKNVVAAKELVRLSKANGVGRLIFISSLAAHDRAKSEYGRSKQFIEKNVWPKSEVIVKPGTIIGLGGLFGRIIDLVQKLPFLPVLFAYSRSLQFIDLQDLVQGIEGILRKNLTGTFVIASLENVPVIQFHQEIVKASGQKKSCVPLPHHPFLWAAYFFERLGIRLPITSENILGLKFMVNQSPHESLQMLSLSPIPFSQSIKKLIVK